jgi:DNA-binding transcriptional LysR family regulator
MGLTMRQLEAFRALMSVGSVTRGAQLLGVSQPTMSRLLADMEAETGLVLFERSSRGLQPTPEAVAFDQEVERAFAGLSQLDAVARAMRGAARLSVAVTPSLVPGLAETLFAPFARKHPDVVLSLDVQTTRRTLEWVVSRQVDFGITFEPVTSPDLEVTVIGTTEAVCMIPHAHRLAKGRGPLSLGELDGEDFVAFKHDSLFRQQLDRLFEDAGARPRIRAEARTTHAACLMAAALPALTVIPSGATHGGFERLVSRPVQPPVPSDIVVVHSVSRPLSAIARDFLHFARESGRSAAQQVQGGRH